MVADGMGGPIRVAAAASDSGMWRRSSPNNASAGVPYPFPLRLRRRALPVPKPDEEVDLKVGKWLRNDTEAGIAQALQIEVPVRGVRPSTSRSSSP